MNGRAFLRRRLARLGDAALNLLPSPVTCAIDRARLRQEIRRLQEQLDAAHAEIAELKRPKTPGEQMREDRDAMARQTSIRIAAGHRDD